MKRISLVNFGLVALIVVAAAAAVWQVMQKDVGPGADDAASGHQHDGEAPAEHPRGPHGGRLLGDKDFAVELTLFERGVPPEFRVYAFADGQRLPPEKVQLSIELARLDGQVDRFQFQPEAEWLRGDGVVGEPHSFDVTVRAGYAGKRYQWQFSSYEGRTRISEAMAQASNIVTATAGPAIINESVVLTGYVQTDPNRLSQVRARFPGIVKTVQREIGQAVVAGEVLATVQSNESLQTYRIKAPIAGLIVRRDLQTGEATGDRPLFVIADLSRVWVQLDVFGNTLNRVRPGQPVVLETLTSAPLEGNIEWLSPLASHASQSVKARVEVDNPDLLLRPGQFVRGRVTVDRHNVPLAVRLSALQRFRDFDVVFAKYDDTYEVRMLQLGRRDGEWVEVLEGLRPGVEYVTGNSYLIKADIEKSGASHDH